MAAALTALVLSGAQGPLGALFPEREEEPRPATASAGPRGGVPTATDIAQVASFSSAAGLGSSWDRSVFGVLLQPGLDRSGMPVDGSSAAPRWPGGTGAGAEGTSSFASAGGPSASSGVAPSAPPSASTAAVGDGRPVRTGSSQDPGGAGRHGAAEPQSPTSSEPRPDEAPADPLIAPVPVLPPALTTAADPVVEAADPVITAVDPGAAPVVKIPAPVVGVPEPEVGLSEPVAPVELPAPSVVGDAARSVGQAVPAAPEAEAEDLPSLDLPR